MAQLRDGLLVTTLIVLVKVCRLLLSVSILIILLTEPTTATSSSSSSVPSTPTTPTAAAAVAVATTQATVLFSWEGTKPNHLSIVKGDSIKVLQHGSGWLMGEGPGGQVSSQL